MATTALAPALLAAAILAALLRPWSLSPAVFAAAAAAAAAALGLLRRGDLGTVLSLTWDATTALVALMILSRLLAEAGLFRWAAWRAAALCGGRPRALFVAAIVLSAAVSALFTNDGTVLILTPVLIEVAAALDLPPETAAAILLANGFIADACSTPLAGSNLVNILAVDAYRLSFAGYARAMGLPSLAALAAAAATLWAVYGRRLPSRPVGGPPPPAAAEVRDPALFWAGLAALGLVAAGFAVTAARPFPIALLLGPAAVGLWIFAAARRGLAAAWSAARHAPWEVIVFASAMNLLVLAAGRQGLLAAAQHVLAPLAGRPWAGPLAVGGLSAAAAALVNNLPATLFALLALHPAPGHGAELVLAAVGGNDIGPKLTPIGSLATLLWLRALRAGGLDFGWRRYLAAGAILTPPTLLAFLLVLAWLR